MFVDLYFRSLIFGKHDGEHLSAVPVGYLKWMLKELDLESYEREAVTKELKRRGAFGSNPDDSKRNSPPPPPRKKVPAGVTPEIILQIVVAGRRALAARLHPDVGGDLEAMKRVNLTADFLEQQARQETGGAAL